MAGGARPAATPADVELPALSQDEIKRYSRHLIMPEVGIDGQRKLKASVLCIGAGGLGSPAAMYLAAAGVGRIGIVDFDVVDYSNLQRQIAARDDRRRRSKLESAKNEVNALNPHVQVDTYETALSSENALELFKRYDVILDGTDNFPTRYLVNDACVLLGQAERLRQHLPVRGAGVGVRDQGRPVLSLPLSEPPPPGLVPSCAEGGVLGVLPGIIGVIQATEAIKLIIGVRRAADRAVPDLRRAEDAVPRAEARKDPECPVCGAIRPSPS